MDRESTQKTWDFCFLSQKNPCGGYRMCSVGHAQCSVPKLSAQHKLPASLSGAQRTQKQGLRSLHMEPF